MCVRQCCRGSRGFTAIFSSMSFMHQDIFPFPACPPLCPKRACSIRLQAIFEATKKTVIFLRSAAKRLRVCVCVSPLVPKGSLPHTLFQPSRGPAADKQTLANKAMLFRWMHSLINCVYLRSTFAQAVLLSFCFMVVLHAIPQNRFPSAVFHCCATAVTHQHCRTLRLS